VYDVDPKMLDVLDDLESHPSLYTRTPIQCSLSSGQLTEVQLYMVHNYKKNLLTLPYLDDYTKDVKPYSHRENRADGYKAADDMKEQ